MKIEIPLYSKMHWLSRSGGRAGFPLMPCHPLLLILGDGVGTIWQVARTLSYTSRVRSCRENRWLAITTIMSHIFI